MSAATVQAVAALPVLAIMSMDVNKHQNRVAAQSELQKKKDSRKRKGPRSKMPAKSIKGPRSNAPVKIIENPWSKKKRAAVEDDSDELNELVRKIFKIIPSYYDAHEAEEIKNLISEFINRESR